MINEDESCFSWLCKCFKKSNNAPASLPSNSNNNNAERVVNVSNVQNNHINQQQPIANVPYNPGNSNNEGPPVIIINTVSHNDSNPENNENDNHINKKENLLHKFQISTKVPKSSIMSSESYKKEMNNKHNCPICLKYFNKIMKLSCCKNYICIFCAEDYLETCSRYEYPLNCPFCGLDDKHIIVDDVQDNEPIKSYSDSPGIDFKKNISSKFSKNFSLTGGSFKANPEVDKKETDKMNLTNDMQKIEIVFEAAEMDADESHRTVNREVDKEEKK